MINRFIFTAFIFISVFNCCRTNKNLGKSKKIDISDSLMHIIKLDSSNIKILREITRNKYAISEYKSDKKELIDIENRMYNFVKNDTLLKKTYLFHNYSEMHRQYFIISDSSNKYLYVRYTYLANTNNIYYKNNSWNWNNNFSIILSEGVFYFFGFYSLGTKKEISFFIYR